MSWIRTRIYRWGFRPKRSSIFYSPSREMEIVMRNVIREGFTKAFKDALKPCRGQNTNRCVAEGCFGESCLKKRSLR